MATQSSSGITRHPILRFSTVRHALANPDEAAAFALGAVRARLARWRADDWEDYYCRMTKRNGDFRALVGPPEDFERMRDWQFQFLQNEGLTPEDTLLDLGCGVCRGGTAFIDYLEPGNYVGMDISSRALQHAHRHIHELGLGSKSPTLIQNDDLSFADVDGLDADYLLAQSVWSHLPPDRLDDCLANMGRALDGNGTVLATYVQADEGEAVLSSDGPRMDVDFSYPHSEIVDRAAAHGWDVELLDMEHPQGQTVVRLTH